jgi:sodium-coupled neutral amino acid transporter 9
MSANGDADAPLLGDDSINALELAPVDTGAPSRFQPRVQTVASIVNTMMGTTILALPLGMSQSGIGAGLLVTALLGVLSCGTCLIVVERGLAAGHADFSGSVGALLGRRAQLVAWSFSVAIILGASIVYHILMQETLYALVNTVAAARGGGGDGGAPAGWSRALAAVVPWALYPICCLKDLSALVRFNSIGFLFLWYTIIFICSHGVRALAGGGGGAPVVAVATLPAGAPPFRADGAFQVVTGGSPMLSGLGGMVRGCAR